MADQRVPLPERGFGILHHVSSMPGPEPIGTLGGDTAEVLRWMADAGASVWQILPLTMNGKDDSPYFSSSAFAGNPWLIDLDGLAAVGLLDEQPGDQVPGRPSTPDQVPFATMRVDKLPRLHAAADRFLATPGHVWHDGFDRFVADNEWVDDAGHFYALTAAHGDGWWRWPEPLRRRDPNALARSRAQLAGEIARWRAMLWFFEVQWAQTKRLANELGLTVVGDLPIYVAHDSADVWAHQDQFQLDESGAMAAQSGVPPDYFSETGQLWGNPLYRWDVMAADGFSWWIRRLARTLEHADVVRIDHFRALAAFWTVPGDATTAVNGRWVPGPGQAFLDAVRSAFPTMPFVAEDLGTLDDDVHSLRDDNDLPGMRILQFGFDGGDDNPHRPDNVPQRCLAYTGTHDNTTLAAWWDELTATRRATVADHLGVAPASATGDAVWSLIEAVFASEAALAVVPVQDVLALGSAARMNDPGSTTGNWGWRLEPGSLDVALARRLRTLAAHHRRA